MLELPLSIKQYAERFHLVLHQEEIQMEEDIKKYDLYGQTMKQDRTNKNLLVLQASVNFSLLFKKFCNCYNMLWGVVLFKLLFIVHVVIDLGPRLLQVSVTIVTCQIWSYFCLCNYYHILPEIIHALNRQRMHVYIVKYQLTFLGFVVTKINVKKLNCRDKNHCSLFACHDRHWQRCYRF